MDWTTILASAALVVALAALAYAWFGFRVITDAAIRNARNVRDLTAVVLDMAEPAAKLHEIDTTLADHLQWHVAQQMRNSVSLLRDIEESDPDAGSC